MSRKKIQDIEKNLSDIGKRLISLETCLNLTQTALSSKLNLSSSYLTEIKYGRSKGGLKFWDAIRRELPKWESFIRGETDISPCVDDADSDKITEAFQIKEVQASYSKLQNTSKTERRINVKDRQALHQMLDTILDHGSPTTIDAIVSNLQQFTEHINTDRRLKQIETEIQQLKKPDRTRGKA